MKKLIFIGVIGLFVLGSCNSKNTGHEGHDHETVTHNHDEHEGHDHEAEGHDHEAEGADHSHEGECQRRTRSRQSCHQRTRRRAQRRNHPPESES